MANAKLGVKLFAAGTVGVGALSLAATRNVFLPQVPTRTEEVNYPVPGTRADVSRDVENPDIRALFRVLVDEWMEDTQNHSDPSVALSHPAYHKILAMGTTALPYIFEEMSGGDGARWLAALDAITFGLIDPIPPEHEMDANLMCQDWLQWGAKNDLYA